MNEHPDAETSYLTTHTQHSQETNIYDPMGFEPTIPESKLPHFHALDRAATDRLNETHKENLFLEHYLKETECETLDTTW